MAHYVKLKYGENSGLCTESTIFYIKAKGIYLDIAKDVEARFNTSNDELERPLPKRKNKKVTGLMKDKSSGKIKTEFCALRLKA